MAIFDETHTSGNIFHDPFKYYQTTFGEKSEKLVPFFNTSETVLSSSSITSTADGAKVPEFTCLTLEKHFVLNC